MGYNYFHNCILNAFSLSCFFCFFFSTLFCFVFVLALSRFFLLEFLSRTSWISIKLKSPLENTYFDKLDGFILGSGCIEVVGCVRGEELARWEMVPEGVGNPLFLSFSFIYGFLDFVD